MYRLTDLPYEYADLEPIISAEIMELHHSKHHAGYVEQANQALESLNSRRGGSEVDIKAVLKKLSFNLNGHLLHEVFWHNMRKPVTDNKLEDQSLLSLLNESFTSFDAFKKEFSDAAVAVEGSGWAVLVKEPSANKLLVMQVENHNKLNITNSTVLLALDVWEHAYYKQYANKRADYVAAWWDVVNWDDVAKRLS